MAEKLSTIKPNAVITDQGMVYCRFPNGELFSCDASDLELMKKIRRGIVPLHQYGQFGSCAYYMDHPFEPLFQAGGAHEMNVAQIVQLGYHLHPPLVPTCERHVGDAKDHLMHGGSLSQRPNKGLWCWWMAKPVEFPQLRDEQLPPRPDVCEFCDRDDFPTLAAFKQHQDVMHNDRRQQQQLGEAIVAGLQRSGAVAGGTSAETVAAAVAATLQAMGYGTARPRVGRPPLSDEEKQTRLREKPNQRRRERRTTAVRIPIETT
jgi:hypothetical protein